MCTYIISGHIFQDSAFKDGIFLLRVIFYFSDLADMENKNMQFVIRNFHGSRYMETYLTRGIRSEEKEKK